MRDNGQITLTSKRCVSVKVKGVICTSTVALNVTK
jgi:hypothetical protein